MRQAGGGGSESLYGSWLLRWASCAIAFVVVLGGCATALKREGRCLESLTSDYLAAREELTDLEALWRASLLPLDPSGSAAHSSIPAQTGQPQSSTAAPSGRASEDAYHRLAEARVRHQATLRWYDRVYERVRTRLEEEQILSDVRMVMMTGPAVIFYPIVRWNIHSVFWDEADPDGETDPITRYCTDRLSQLPTLAEADP